MKKVEEKDDSIDPANRLKIMLNKLLEKNGGSDKEN